MRFTILLFVFILSWFSLHPYKRNIYINSILHIRKFIKYYSDFSLLKILIMLGLLLGFPIIGHIDQLIMPTIVEHYSVLYQSPYYLNGKEYNESKIFWKLFLEKYHIPTPPLAYIKKNGKVLYKNNELIKKESTEIYVLKPEIGQSGNGIVIGPLNQLLEKTYINCIIEKFTNDCYMKNKEFRKFRIITLYTGDVILVKEIISRNKMVSANLLLTANTTCNKQVCSHLSYKEKYELEKAKITLSNLHKTHLNYQYSIGWDILFDCDRYTVIEGNGGGHGLVGVDMKKYKKGFYDYLTSHAELV